VLLSGEDFAGDAESIRNITREVLLMPDPATAVVASDGLLALSVVEAIAPLPYGFDV
jgi:LacI family transcriptional regulator